jgi:hypothetical protein
MQKSIFPVKKRFSDLKKDGSTVLLTEDVTIWGKHLRSGSVCRILGWREVNGKPYYVVSKGSWEALIEHSVLINIVEHC